ncbi:MAG: hypothetical protein K2X67_04710 [Burkholderiales bacterium]|jgi:hypothetical protein|nr:hypothetical protein [Burkholderiales bacterium]
MDAWDLLSYAAWAVSALLFIWMLADAWGVGRNFDEDFLLSSREGEE